MRVTSGRKVGAAIVAGGPTRVILHWESYEVQMDGKVKRVFFDTNAFRRGVNRRVES